MRRLQIQSARIYGVTLLVGMLCSAALPTQADPLYDIAGEAVLTGNNSCGGPCLETIDFNFVVDTGFFDPFFQAYSYQIVSAVGTVSGVLGSRSGPFCTAPCDAALRTPANSNHIDANYLSSYSAPADEIDITLTGNLQSAPTAPTIRSVHLYRCENAACDATFGDVIGLTGYPGAFIEASSLHYTVTGVPESGNLVPLGIGMLILLVGIKARVRSA